MFIVSAQALASAKEAAAATAPAIPSSQDQLIQVSLALAVVLGLIYAIAWLVKRKQMVQGFTNIPMKTIGVLPLGVKEKIILVEVGGKQILLGMTASSINTLAEFDEPIIDASEKQVHSFSQKLKAIMAQTNKESTDQESKVKHDEK